MKRAGALAHWAAPLFAAFAALAAYGGSLRGSFVYDDWFIVVNNPAVRSGSWRLLLASSYWSRGQNISSGDAYRPLTIATYALNARWTGFAPLPFHLVNVALHAANAALVAVLGATLGLPAAAAAFCGAAFALLPIHTEAVSWIVGRAELLACFFALAAWLCLYRARSWRRLVAGLLLFVAALASKESSAALPAAFALSELAGPEKAEDVFRERAPVWAALLIVVGLYLEWRHFILGSALAIDRPYFQGVGPLTTLLTMARFFLAKWLAPIAAGAGLCADYSRPVFADARPGDPLAWLWLAGACALAAWALWDFARRRRPLSLGVLVLLALAAPLSNLIVPMPIIGAERLMYLPSVGFCLSAGALAAAALRWKRQAAVAAAAALLVAWAFLASRRNEVWRDDDALWAATADCAPSSPRVMMGLGERAEAAGRHAEARDYYRRARAADPALRETLFAEGRSYFFDNDDASARRLLIEQLRQGPDARAWGLLGILEERAGRPEAALQDYQRSLAVDPYYPASRRNLGVLLYKRGRLSEARQELERYLALRPPEAEASEIRAFLGSGFRAAGTAPR